MKYRTLADDDIFVVLRLGRHLHVKVPSQLADYASRLKRTNRGFIWNLVKKFRNGSSADVVPRSEALVFRQNQGPVLLSIPDESFDQE